MQLLHAHILPVSNGDVNIALMSNARARLPTKPNNHMTAGHFDKKTGSFKN